MIVNNKPQTKGDRMKTLPTISTYGNYSSSNYGAHCLRVTIGNVTVWFSYQTPVAFSVNGSDIVCRHNNWGPTTGKHLNAIEPNHKKRVDSTTFEVEFSKAMETVN